MPGQHQLRPADQIDSHDAIQCWDEAAEEFASFFAEGGDRYHKHIINPCLLALAGDLSGKTVLDLACGEGHLARHLAELTHGDIRLLGVDASQAMIRIARERSQAFPHSLTFQQGDATDLRGIAADAFDIVICNMALQDIKDYQRAICEAARVLKPGGAFLFSILHPCFFTPGCGWLTDDQGDIIAWRVNHYHSSLAWKCTVKHQMSAQAYMFHRPLEDYAAALRDSGFVITDMREPTPSPQLIAEHPKLARELRRGGFWVVRCALPEDAAGQRYPEPTVGALIVDTRGRLLLLKSHKWRGKYVVPGGHIELGERLEDALRREVKEETGLDIDCIEFLCFQEFVYDDAFWQPRHFIFFDFVCHTASTLAVLNDEAEDYVWVSPEEALVLPIEPYTEVTIREYLRRQAEGRCILADPQHYCHSEPSEESPSDERVVPGSAEIPRRPKGSSA
jgi:ADP-ribose pyrophosphatase YjhB (NUDIX family)/2-polyprenyl-3-methyl-5-hydroxy-6-metoxy-1,4-benzoquinol methylase